MVATLATRMLRLVGSFGAGMLLVGCAGEGKVDNTARDAAIYHAIITDLFDRAGPASTDGDELPVVFIETLAAEAIPLETQVEVVAEFTEVYEIRFIDDIDEAVEIDVESRPVRPNSVLIGLGPIQLETTADVRGEVYLESEDVRAYRYSFIAGADDEWRMVGSPAATEPEGFLPSP